MQIACRRAAALFVSLLFFFSFAAVASAQNTIHVPADAPTIQQAIFVANNGDVVMVSPGTYFETLNFQGKAITVQSTEGPAVTTIDAGLSTSVVQFINGETPETVLRGFTITHGIGAQGAGINLFNSSPTIEKNIITENQGCDGVGISAQSSSSIIRNNTISNNSGFCSSTGGAGVEIVGPGTVQLLNNTITGNQLSTGGTPGNGAGVFTDSFATPVISGNTIQNNTTTANGGGIFIAGAAQVTDNLLSGNSAALGGGIYTMSDVAAPSFANNTVTANTAGQGAQLYIDGSDANVELANNLLIDLTGTGAVFCGSSAGQVPAFDHNDLFSVAPGGTQSPAYTGACSDQTGISGNIQADPLFLDPASANFHLQLSSPAVDAGNNSAANLPATDLDGNIRVAASNTASCNGVVDMGAYEIVAPSSGAGFLSLTRLDFGPGLIGEPNLPQLITFSASQGCVQVASIVTRGDFQQTSNCGTLAAGASCTIQVTFNPTAPGLRLGSLQVNLGAGVPPASATLTGQGQNSAFLFPSSLDFGNQPVQTSSPSMSATVTRTSDNPFFQVSSISVTGDFAQTNFCNFSPLDVCQVQVTFTPTTPGLHAGTLTIATNQGVFMVPLFGTGLGPIASVAPSSLPFGTQAIGTASAGQVLTLSNIGTADLQVSALVSSPDFQVQPLTCSGIVPAGGSCTYAVAFTPSSAADETGTLEIDTTGGKVTVPLSGSGTSPIATLSPQVLSFAGVPIGSSGTSQTVAFTNVSGTTLQINSIGATNNFLAASTCPPVLDPNASCTIDVSLAPNTPGPYNGFLRVATSLGDVTAPLSGSDGHHTLRVPADFPTIGSAIFAAQDGDTVLVSPGTYFEGISFQGKAITVKSAAGAAVTIVDGNNSFPPVVFNQSEPPQAVLKGFTVRHGFGSGVAIFNSSPTLEDNVIRDNTACNGQGGVGITISSASPIIRRNVIRSNVDSCGLGGPGTGILVEGAGSQGRVQLLNNTITDNQGSVSGGGIAVISNGNALIQSNTIENNSTNQNGGGVFVDSFSAADVVQNLIAGNSALSGGGVYETFAFFSSPLLENNTIANNTSLSGTALFVDGVDGNLTVTNNLLIDSAGFGPVACGATNGLTPAFSNNDVMSTAAGVLAYGGICQDVTGVNGNIQQDPQFVDPPRDYHLQPTSPALDAGIILAGSVPDQDLDGNSRTGPGNAQTCVPAIDMGAYEFQLVSSGTPFLPTTFDVGTAAFGGSNTASLTISASGCVQVSSVRGSGDFQPSTTCNAVSSSSTCNVDVLFTPADPGIRTGLLKFDFGKSSPAQTVTLTGTAVEFALNTSSTSLNFGNQAVQTTSAAQSVVVSPFIFTSSLQVNGIWMNGDFSQTNNCSVSNPAGSSCTFNVTFTPTASGIRTGSLVVSTNQGLATVSLIGNGLAAASATLTPTSLAFGNQLVNTTSATQVATLTNTGTTSFVPGAITVSGDFLLKSSQCNVTLLPGTSCTYALSFRPIGIGSRTGVFTVQTDAGPFSVNLSGTGVAPQLGVSPQSLSFPNQVVNTPSAAQTVTLVNLGTANLNLIGISSPGDFAQTSTCTTSIAPGASCTVNVTFTPTALGNRTGALTISSDGGNFSVPLSGAGFNAFATVAQTAVSFGSELLHSTTSARSIILTAGIDSLQITEIGTSSADFAQTSTCGASLAAGASCSIQVTFTPAAQGGESGTLTVTSNEGLLTVALSGNGIARAANGIYVPVDQTTIQAAISAAAIGQTVYVLPGTYPEHINYQGKAITVTSTDGPAASTIDGSLTGTVVTFSTGEGVGSVLSGFTITRGTSTFDGSGILVSSASPTITGNTITANQGCQGIGIAVEDGNPVISGNTISNNTQVTCSGGNGGGIYAGGGAPQILNNVISGNQLLLGGEGGGITLNGSSATVSGNTIQNNSVFNNGGGISTFNGDSPSIIQNLITGNFSNSNGGGISISVSSGSRGPLVVNNTIVNNTAASGSAVYSEGFVASVELVNNILIATPGAAALECNGLFAATSPILNANDAFSSGGTGFAGACSPALGTNGNVSVDPEFVDPIGGNFHLQATSPVLDAGNNSAPLLPVLDLDNNPRVAFGSATACSDTIDLGVYEFALATTPSATLSPASFDFGIQSVGTTGASQAFTLTAIQGCVVPGTVRTTGDFTQTNNCSSALATGGSCVVQVSFTPMAGGLRPGSLSVSANSGLLESTLTGQGAFAAAGFSPASLDFSNQRVQTTSAAQQLTLTNSGNVSLQITSISISGPFSQTNACPASLAPGTSCSIVVTFTPTAIGAASGTLTIASNGSSSPNTVPLTGTGTAPLAVLTPSLDFSAQNVGTTSPQQTATLANNGNVTLNVSSIAVAGDFTATSGCPAALAPATSCNIQVTFRPTTAGARSGSLVITDDDPAGGQQSTALTGTGLDYSVSASPSIVSVNSGQTALYTITVTGLGGNFTTAVSLACSGLPEGANCVFSPTSVVPGAGSASSSLSLVVSGGQHGTKKTPDGTYAITVLGTAGQLTHSTTVQLVVR